MSAMWIPIIGAITGLVIPLAAFMWSYIEGKEKRETILEIARTVDDPDKVNELLAMLEEKKSDPVDYRRGGMITLFVGAGIYMLGAMALGGFFKGIGALVGLIGMGVLVAGYLYPNTTAEINQAVEAFEER